jgi:signal transduction histidine kinase
MMQAFSIRTLAATFTVAGIVLCLTISFVIALAFPEPPPRQITVTEARDVLLADGPVPGWRRRLEPNAPFAAARSGQGFVVQAGLVALLGAPPVDVRVRSLQLERMPSPVPAGNIIALDSASSEAQSMIAAMALGPGTSFAPFETAVRQADGRWLVLTPATPLFTPQRLRMSAAFAVAALLLLPIALWGAERLTSPFLRLAEAARGPGERSAAAFVGGPREAREAARALDEMRKRLSGALRERTAIMAAIAHDLRTPLTGLRLRMEGLPADLDAPRAAAADIGRMERLIAQLLTYVRGEEAPWTVEPLDLADVARSCVARQQDLGRAISVVAESEQLVRGDRDQLERALDNLIENAMAYGERAKVTVASEAGDGLCQVDDEGPGIPPEELEAVFEPFRRLEVSRNRSTGGAGLGLAIARSIMQRCGGSLALMNKKGGGLRAEIRLPLIVHPKKKSAEGETSALFNEPRPARLACEGS